MDDFQKTRELIYENIKKELLGPGSEEIGSNDECEIITDEPIARYSIGILFPQECKQEQEEDDILNTTEGLRIDVNETDNEENKEKGNEKIKFKHKNIVQNIKIENEIDEKISMANELRPSSMGITFFAKGNLEKLNLRIKCAKYRISSFKDCCVKYKGEDFFIDTPLNNYVYRDGELLKLKDNLSSKTIKESIDIDKYKDDEFLNQKYREMVACLYALSRQCPDETKKRYSYVRQPVNFPETISIVLNQDYIKKELKEYKTVTSTGIEIETNLEIYIVREKYEGSIYCYTVVLVNADKVTKYGRDLKSIFQPEIRIKTEDNIGMRLIDNRQKELLTDDYDMDIEEKSLELLYRDKRNYAIGHGVSTGQDVNDETGLGEIWTTYLPRYEVPKLSFELDGIDTEESDEMLSMRNLSDESELLKEEKVNNLKKLISLYELWIVGLKDDLNSLDDRFKEAANRNIEECKLSLDRMKRGISLIEKNTEVYIAFSLMNRALLMQRVHSGVPERYPGDMEKPFPKINYKNISIKEAKWRPFQLAYILMCIESIVDPSSDDRDLVDLIWVPTGGGKTEAYLGLSAFTIFLRRLKYPKNYGGTAIIMRYTLRLLAAQQFIRASIMICACEIIRREGKYNLGKEKITIGLWIGSTQTPNTKKEAKKLFEKLTENANNRFDLDSKKDENNKFQLLKCPWCGTKLEKEYDNEIQKGIWGYRFKGKDNIIFCPEEDCPFTRGENLPVQVVDECIYENPPTLLFGTVDKFAMITWEVEASRLFALDSGNKNLSPELIIQDELHLISGSLGTIVGLYETAVDAMCSEKGIKPKIIASTATIRRAKEQCKQLYARDVKQFPSPGLLAENSFFTKEDAEKPGRLYVGLSPSGKTLTTTQVRLMSALTNRVKMLDIPEKVKSEYWTLVGYFNTLKELGMTNSLIHADIQDNIDIVSNRLLNKKNARKLYNVAELTSRKTANEINKTLKNLEVNYSSDNIKENKWAIDVLLASNMISVGVDVSRLNLMMLLQQPKLTSEYIQATSRVGRKNPGIVFTLFSPSRSRDKSHYEMFYDYHQSFYKYVEPTSVTCFSEPARDRMLHSVFISMIRHILGLASEDSAQRFSRDLEGLSRISKTILERANILDDTDNKDTVEEVKKEIDKIIFDWEDKINNLSGTEMLKYSKGKDYNLIKSFEKDNEDNAWPTLTSMRNVDQQGRVDILIFRGDENE